MRFVTPFIKIGLSIWAVHDPGEWRNKNKKVIGNKMSQALVNFTHVRNSIGSLNLSILVVNLPGEVLGVMTNDTFRAFLIIGL